MKFGESYLLSIYCQFTTAVATYSNAAMLTLCIDPSPFLPRDVMRKRVFAVARCLSVRLSVTLVYCIHTAEDVVKLICRPDSPITLDFWSQAPILNSKWNPFNGGAKYKGVEKFCDFGLKSPSITETVRDGPMLIWNVNRKSYALYRMVTFSMTLIDPWPGFQGRDIFRHWISQKWHEIEP